MIVSMTKVSVIIVPTCIWISIAMVHAVTKIAIIIVPTCIWISVAVVHAVTKVTMITAEKVLIQIVMALMSRGK